MEVMHRIQSGFLSLSMWDNVVDDDLQWKCDNLLCQIMNNVCASLLLSSWRQCENVSSPEYSCWLKDNKKLNGSSGVRYLVIDWLHFMCNLLSQMLVCYRIISIAIVMTSCAWDHFMSHIFRYLSLNCII